MRTTGANEFLAGLGTDESKAAYLIQIIAVELYKASKAIDPTVHSLSVIFRATC